VGSFYKMVCFQYFVHKVRLILIKFGHKTLKVHRKV
jgi:hypothetical protein